MKTEAIKVENGFLIPMNDVLRGIKKDKILVKLEIVDPPGEVDYSHLDDIIGLCKTNKTDASINHDKITHGGEKK